MFPDKRGYLNSDFHIFYLTNTEARDFQSHYHDFHKLLIFESGSLSYYIEGETYQLQPWDIVLVPAGEVHRPVIHDHSPYRRLILYIAPAFLEQYSSQQINPYLRFERSTASPLLQTRSASGGGCSHILRIKKFQESRLNPVFLELRQSAVRMQLLQSQAPSASVQHITVEALLFYQQTVLLQFLFLITHLADGNEISFPPASGCNQQILQALAYINEHLQEDLCIDKIAGHCFLNRSYLMHLFRRETGYSILSYLTEKRLFSARTLIQSGVPVTEACLQSGFQSYSAFYRAYHKKFGEAPKQSRQT